MSTLKKLTNFETELTEFRLHILNNFLLKELSLCDLSAHIHPQHGWIQLPLKISSMLILLTMTLVSPSMMPLTMLWTCVSADAFVWSVPFRPVRRVAYFINATSSSSGPIVNTAGKANDNFSIVIACRDNEKSNGTIESFATCVVGQLQYSSLCIAKVYQRTFCHGNTKAFLAILTVSIPAPVMAS